MSEDNRTFADELRDEVRAVTNGKPKKMEPYTPAWDAKANALARSYCPTIYPCHDCGAPVIRSYRCEFCGSCNPEGY